VQVIYFTLRYVTVIFVVVINICVITDFTAMQCFDVTGNTDQTCFVDRRANVIVDIICRQREPFSLSSFFVRYVLINAVIVLMLLYSVTR
jgi:hypothetical protein